MTVPPPSTLPALTRLIEHRLPGLSPQFQRIGRYLIANPEEVALAPLRVLAGHVGAHPSAPVRLAKALGYDGFREMQRVFKAALFARADGAGARALRLHRDLVPPDAELDLARTVVAQEMAALQELLEGLHQADLLRAGEILSQARLIWIAGDADRGPAALSLRRELAAQGRPAILVEPGHEATQLAAAEAADALVVLRREEGALPPPACACPSVLLGGGASAASSAGTIRLALPPLSGGAALLPVLIRIVVAHTARAARPHAPATLFADFDPLGW